MVQIASKSQLRMSFLRWALFIVPLILLLGWFSGQYSGSGEENRWYSALTLPEMRPPAWAFGLVWTILYALMGIALSIILHARGAKWRGIAIGLFIMQLALNLLWSPVFFAAHQVGAALVLLILIFILALATTVLFSKIRKAAAWCMVPYLAWLVVAGLLNWQIDKLNPNAETLVVPAADAQIEF